MNATVADQLRARMVEVIMESGSISTGPVERALREVPRHAFVPAASVAQAYDPDRPVITKRASDGRALSCASVPTLMAGMLEQLQVHPGDRIFECGAGTGYNAALLAYLTGPRGRVTTIDIDPEVTAGAARALEATGYGRVHVRTRDGALGDVADAPYDRMIVTVGAWDLPPAWWQQLAPGGRLVVPLRWRGQTRGVAFVHGHDGVLRSDSVRLCGFVPMLGHDGERTAAVDPDQLVSLHWDADQPIDPAALTGVLAQPKTAVWSDATVGPYDPFDGVWLRMTATDPAVCRIAVEPAAVETGLCIPAIPVRSPALVEGDSLAYFTFQRLNDPERRGQLGAIGHGPTGQLLAERLCRHIHAWNTDRDAQPTITAYPRPGTQHPTPATPTITKKHSQLTITY
jgi:protein-L-isoaspartate(D-aspartate) O-methyltransferase